MKDRVLCRFEDVAKTGAKDQAKDIDLMKRHPFLVDLLKSVNVKTLASVNSSLLVARVNAALPRRIHQFLVLSVETQNPRSFSANLIFDFYLSLQANILFESIPSHLIT